MRIRKSQLKGQEVYRTKLGTAYCGDSLDLLPAIPDRSIQAIITSPPFALQRQKQYGNVPASEYIDWFMQFAKHLHRVLKEDGSLVIDIGGAWLPGRPVRSIYQFELLVALVRDAEFYLAEEFYWFNKAKLPSPVQWVNVERCRVKDAVNPIWWLSPGERPKADNRRVLKPYSQSMKRLLVKGYNAGLRPSGHLIGTKWGIDNGGAIPPNLIEVANTRSADDYQKYCREHDFDIHPARFPREVPEFFIKLVTEPGDVVLDPFGGSNMTGAVADALGRKWITMEIRRDYLDGSFGRFPRP